MNTMNRCTASASHPAPLTSRTSRRLTLATLLLASLAGTASAQQVRDFPPNALRGKLVVTAPPQVMLDGKADQLSPGARIRNPQNMFIMSGSLVGQDLVVNYVREGSGLIHEVWLLTPAEAALKRPSAKGSSLFLGSDGKSITFGIDNKAP